MDKGEYENELKQVIGDTRAAFDISEHDTLVFGEHGILVAGPNSRHHEPLLCSYVQFISMDIFVRNFFNRLFLIIDAMKEVRDHRSLRVTFIEFLITNHGPDTSHDQRSG